MQLPAKLCSQPLCDDSDGTDGDGADGGNQNSTISFHELAAQFNTEFPMYTQCSSHKCWITLTNYSNPTFPDARNSLRNRRGPNDYQYIKMNTTSYSTPKILLRLAVYGILIAFGQAR